MSIEIPKLLTKRDALFYDLNRTEFRGRFIMLNYIDLQKNLKIYSLLQSLKSIFENFKFDFVQFDSMTRMKSEKVLGNGIYLFSLTNEIIQTTNIFEIESASIELHGKCDCLIVFVLTSGDTSQGMLQIDCR